MANTHSYLIFYFIMNYKKCNSEENYLTLKNLRFVMRKYDFFNNKTTTQISRAVVFMGVRNNQITYK